MGGKLDQSQSVSIRDRAEGREEVSTYSVLGAILRIHRQSDWNRRRMFKIE